MQFGDWRDGGNRRCRCWECQIGLTASYSCVRFRIERRVLNRKENKNEKVECLGRDACGTCRWVIGCGGRSKGTGPSEGSSAGVIWREAIRLAGIVCAQGADVWRETRSRGTRDPTAGLCEMRGRKKPQMLVRLCQTRLRLQERGFTQEVSAGRNVEWRVRFRREWQKSPTQ